MKLLMISGDRSMLSGKKGAFWYTLELLSKEWERVDIICPNIGASGHKPPAASGQRPEASSLFFGNVFFHPSPTGLLGQSHWIVEKGTELIRIHGHDVMTVHEYPPFYNGRGARKLSDLTRVPFVLEVHHIVGYPVAVRFTEWVGRMMSRLYLPRAVGRAAACRTVSKGTAETLIRWGAPASRVRVVPSFYLDRALIEGLGQRPTPRSDVVFCGRLVSNKGADQLLRAVALLPKATLLVIGDGPERQTLRHLAVRLGISHRVEFRGWLGTQQDVLQAVRSARMLVMNSTSEGGPRVPLEAMACGVPVIVTKVGVMPDVIDNGRNGLFTTGEPEDLAQKIQWMIDHPEERARIGDQGRQILDRFERDKLIKNYADFLKSFARPL